MSFASKSISFDRHLVSIAPVGCFGRRSTIPSRRSFLGAREPLQCDHRTILRAEAAQSAEFRWPDWAQAWRFLTDNGIQTVNSQRARDMVQSGKWLLVDVRPSSSFEKCHIEKSVTVPLFNNVDWSNATPMAYIRAAAYLVNGVSPVSINDKFESQLDEHLKDGKGLIFYCETGGTMVPSTNFMYGKESRSLKACFRALKADPSMAVAHLEDGILGWYRAGLPLIGDYDESNVGRTPNTAQAPEIKPEDKK